MILARSASIRSASKYTAHNPVSKHRNIEVYEEASLDPGQPKVGDQLGLVNRDQFLNTLNLKDDLSFDNKIKPIAAIKLSSPVFNRNHNFPRIRKAYRFKLISQARLIRRLKQTGTQPPMNLDGCPNDLRGQRILIHIPVFLPFSVPSVPLW